VSVAEVIAARGILEILHFTTNSGLAGILASRAVKSRAVLPTEKTLEHVYSPNCTYRKDTAWLGYVNLSITSINLHLFGISADKWHAGEDLWWCILSFDPSVLTHEGVYFTTTNNMYTGVRRGQGGAGLEALFAPNVTRWAGNVASRTDELSKSQPTCAQAEVLYPTELSTGFLRRIYVREAQDGDTVNGMFGALDHPQIEVVVAVAMFA
jgi:ssDNA thymidine ADP-ribosyltransferase, DarT